MPQLKSTFSKLQQTKYFIINNNRFTLTMINFGHRVVGQITTKLLLDTLGFFKAIKKLPKELSKIGMQLTGYESTEPQKR